MSVADPAAGTRSRLTSYTRRSPTRSSASWSASWTPDPTAGRVETWQRHGRARSLDPLGRSRAGTAGAARIRSVRGICLSGLGRPVGGQVPEHQVQTDQAVLAVVECLWDRGKDLEAQGLLEVDSGQVRRLRSGSSNCRHPDQLICTGSRSAVTTWDRMPIDGSGLALPGDVKPNLPPIFDLSVPRTPSRACDQHLPRGS